MEEISKKNEKLLGLVNSNSNKNRRGQSKEMRGESPIRKFSSTQLPPPSSAGLINSASSHLLHKNNSTNTMLMGSSSAATATTAANSSNSRLVKTSSQQNLNAFNSNNNNNSSSSNLMMNSSAPVTGDLPCAMGRRIVERPSSTNRININQQSPHVLAVSQPIQPVHPFQQTVIFFFFAHKSKVIKS